MIAVFYDRQRCQVRIRGHAGAGPAGRDLVCAGVSALAYTLAANVFALERSGAAVEVTVRMEPGDCFIACRGVPGRESKVQAVYATVCLGLAGLARGYPEYVRYGQKG